MSTKTFDLEPDEQILRKVARVRCGFWSAFTGELVLTNQALVYVDRGLLGNFKGYKRFELTEITQVIVGEAQNGSDQLEVYYPGGQDDFALQSGGKRELRSWKKAIDKQIASCGGHPVVEEGEGADTEAEGIPFVGDALDAVVEVGGGVIDGVARGVRGAAEGILNGLGFSSEGDAVQTNGESGKLTSEQVDALKKLKELFDMGVLTQEEFDAKKRQILGI